jgi:competence/damage-inducible protein CinA-like protein
MSNPSAEIIAVGTELLLGEIVDTNSAEIAVTLRQLGIDLYRTGAVGDNLSRIAEAVATALHRADIVILTGGLGPTVDDMTRQAIAQAAGIELVFEPTLWQQIEQRFASFGRRAGDNNRRQAYLPQGGNAIENPIGTAPAFWLDYDGRLVVALPGVPSEMRSLLRTAVVPLLQRRFPDRRVIVIRILRTAGMGESDLDAKIADLEAADNPTLGVAAHPGRVDLRLTASAGSENEARAMLTRLEDDLRERLGPYIYGVDRQTLEDKVLAAFAERGWRLVSVEAGTNGALAGSISGETAVFAGGWLLPEITRAGLEELLQAKMAEAGAQAGLGLVIPPGDGPVQLSGRVQLAADSGGFDRPYAGPPENAADWGVSLLLDMARRRLG